MRGGISDEMHADSAGPLECSWLEARQMHRNIKVDDPVAHLAHRVAMHSDAFADSSMAHLNWCLQHSDGNALTFGVSAVARH